MKNVQRSIRLSIASVFAIEGAIIQALVSHALAGEMWAVMGTIISCAVFVTSILAVTLLELGADRHDQYGVTSEGYTSIHDIFNSEESAPEQEESEGFDEITSDFHNPDRGRVYIGEIDQPVFDLEVTEPTYSETHGSLVLAGRKEFAVSTEGDVTPHTVEIGRVPVKPSREPSAPTGPVEFEASMLDFHIKPLEDPDFLLAMEGFYQRMKSDDKLVLIGKSYGLGARGFRREGGATVYSKSDVKKIIGKFLSNPQRGVKAIGSGPEEGAEK